MEMLNKVRGLFHSEADARSRRGGEGAVPRPGVAAASVPGVLRHSNGLREFLSGFEQSAAAHENGLRVLDLGSTSSANLNFFTERGHGIHSDDLLLEALQPRYQIPPQNGGGEPGPSHDADIWLRENLLFPANRFDAVLLWDLVDYLPEPLVKPLMERLNLILKPGGTVLSYFHTRDAGPEALFFRYSIHDMETLQLRPGTNHQLQRIFNNRHIENLFRGYRSVKFFLARDNLREVLATK